MWTRALLRQTGDNLSPRFCSVSWRVWLTSISHCSAATLPIAIDCHPCPSAKTIVAPDTKARWQDGERRPPAILTSSLSAVSALFVPYPLIVRVFYFPFSCVQCHPTVLFLSSLPNAPLVVLFCPNFTGYLNLSHPSPGRLQCTQTRSRVPADLLIILLPLVAGILLATTHNSSFIGRGLPAPH